MSNGLLVVQLNPNPISSTPTQRSKPISSPTNFKLVLRIQIKLKYALGIKPIPNQISDGLALKVVGGHVRDEGEPLQAPLALVLVVQRAVRQLLLGAHVAANLLIYRNIRP